MIENGISKILNNLVDKKDLNEEECGAIMECLLSGQLSAAQTAAFLTAMRMKGESALEITAFAKLLRSKSVQIDLEKVDCIDTCGTGGDGGNTYNVSTAVTFVLAAAGVFVAKHGNRSVSSKCGSADVLEKLGIKIDLTPEMVKESILTTKFGFMFAPLFHKTMKNVAETRKEIGIRTVFNILGPLVNPANAKFQLIGVYNRELLSKMTNVLKNLNSKRVMVVHSEDGLDEISVTGITHISELRDGKITEYKIQPQDFGLPVANMSEIKAGSPCENAKIILEVLSGELGAKRNMVLLNAGAALYTYGKTNSILEGIRLAEETLDNGSALIKLYEVRDFSGGNTK